MATLDADDRIYLEALLAPVRQTLERHERALFGNGQQGLMERTTQRDGTLGLHAKRLMDLETDQHAHGNRDRLTYGGISTVVAAIVAGIVAALRPQ